MKIRLAHNPLASTVELDEGDLRALRLRLEIEDLEERLVGVSLRLREGGQLFDLAKAREESDCSFMDEPLASARAARFDQMAELYRSELMGVHSGDCTCVACSCMKCHAEALVGVDTLGKVGKHELHKIEGAFGGESPARTAEEAAAKLDIPMVATEEWHAPHLARWNAEREQAARYMREHAKKMAAQDKLDDRDGFAEMMRSR